MSGPSYQPLLNDERELKSIPHFNSSGAVSSPPATCADCLRPLEAIRFCTVTGRPHASLSAPPPMPVAAIAVGMPVVSAPVQPMTAIPPGSQYVPMQMAEEPHGSTFDIATIGVESMGTFTVFEDEKVTFASKHTKCCDASSLMISDRRVVMRTDNATCCCAALPRSVWIASLPAEAADVGVQTIRVPSAFWRKVVFLLATVLSLGGFAMTISGIFVAKHQSCSEHRDYYGYHWRCENDQSASGTVLIIIGSLIAFFSLCTIFMIKMGCWCCCLVTTVELAFNRRVPGTWFKTFWQHMRDEKHAAQCEAAFRALRPRRKMVESEHLGGVGMHFSAA
eukprot:TRINITY_DN837_c0_g2_i1.p1 TRINITY_DN837_c0_g2~~TRINITY_DN837_c0_g2_i1.p1  ORF type:complete len:336 (+),score=52.24 TRINITY_DN837_c0_g2_i1:114-1121(+)